MSLHPDISAPASEEPDAFRSKGARAREAALLSS